MQPKRRLTLVALAMFALACHVDQASDGPMPPAFDLEGATSPAPLILHVVAPQATDAAIDRALDNHYVWLDTTARTNHELLVFLPGTALRPAVYQLVEQEAARLGYHVIGLMYVNSPGLGPACGGQADPNACYEAARLEIIDGIDRSPVVDVNRTNSIDHRLTKLLQYLAARYPDEGWADFLVDEQPKWPRIAISGHSQGGGEAAMIAKLRVVARVVLFSAVTDSVHVAAPAWEATHVTPANRYWGLAHDRDEQFRPERAGWDSLGMAVFGPAMAPETSEPPYGFTHMLVTDLPLRGPGRAAHGAPVNDLNTPLGPDGTPLLRAAWRYLLTARSEGDEIAERSDE